MFDDTYMNEHPMDENLLTIYELDQSFKSYEEELLMYMRQGNIHKAEKVLLNFCMEALQLPEDKQLFAARLFFTSFITNIVRIQSGKQPLPPTILARAYALIYDIEQWETISDYMTSTPSFIKRVKEEITLPHLLFQGNEIIENALTIIYNKLESSELTVNLIASELNVSSAHITNLFKKYLNITPSDYIAKQKIKAIINDLEETTDSLHTIRKRFGFYNHSHFIQFFKKHTNLTPLQYLQKHVY